MVCSSKGDTADPIVSNKKKPSVWCLALNWPSFAHVSVTLLSDLQGVCTTSEVVAQIFLGKAPFSAVILK